MIALLLLAHGTALADAMSADFELLRPAFTYRGLPGIDSPAIDAPGTLRAGLLGQYERDPLVLYSSGAEAGAVVSNRQTACLGVSWDFARNISTGARLPLAMQWGSEVAGLSGDGVGMADSEVGLRIRVLNHPLAQLGIRTDLSLPTGTRSAWLGEPQPRLRTGGMALAQLGAFELLADAGFLTRQTRDTGYDFLLGTELYLNAAARWSPWPEHAALSLGLLSRGGTENFMRGGAENSTELLSIVQIKPTGEGQWDLGFGKGLADGYGTSEFRALLGYTWRISPPEPAPLPQLVITELETEHPNAAVVKHAEEPPKSVWREDELARIEGQHIVIRDPIQFEFNKAVILPESIPTLVYVGALLNDNWQIGHLVIEGHASEEGSYEYNYDLSIRRARAIWEQLVLAGVHPDRISYRGMGEVQPVEEGADETSLAANRRVIFQIVREYEPLEPQPDYASDLALPWNGEDRYFAPPRRPPLPDEVGRQTQQDEEKLDPTQFMDEDEEGLRLDGDESSPPTPAEPSPAPEAP